MDAEFLARMAVHRAAFVFLVKALEAKHIIASPDMVSLIRSFVESCTLADDDPARRWVNAEATMLIASLETEAGDGWTPVVIPGGKK
jgi:hypothetical protein